MAKYKEIVYLVLDECKLHSDDSTYTEDHVIFLANKYRAMLLKQYYADIKKQMPESNYQTICLDLTEVPAIAGVDCVGGSYLRSTEKIPSMMNISSPKVYPVDFYSGNNIAYVSRDRMKYVGHNRYLQNIIYASLGPDNYLYFTSANPQFLYMQKARLTGVFEDPQEANDLACDDTGKTCDLLDAEFPLEEPLIPQLITSVLKELLGASYRPADDANNATDDLANLATFLRNNTKSALGKALDDE